MKHIVTQSHGKDSETLAIWAEENLGVAGVDWIPAFWDTKWEHPITYAHLNYLDETLFHGTLVRRASKTYFGGFVEMCVDRKGLPVLSGAFCTQELKVIVQHEFIQELDEITLVYGIRSDESDARALMRERQWVRCLAVIG